MASLPRRLAPTIVRQAPPRLMADSPAAALTPVQRLLHLLAAERPDIAYLCVYAALAGLITLSLPLGVQAVIGFVGSGEVSTSLVVLIGFIVAGTLRAGGLQVMQIYLAEVVQQRLYARVALDFAVRLPPRSPWPAAAPRRTR